MVINRTPKCDRCGFQTKHMSYVVGAPNASFCHSCADDFYNKKFMIAYCEDCGTEYYCDPTDEAPYQCEDCKPLASKYFPWPDIRKPPIQQWCIDRGIKDFVKEHKKQLFPLKRMPALQQFIVEKELQDHLTNSGKFAVDARENNRTFAQNIEHYYNRWMVEEAFRQLSELMLEQAWFIYQAKKLDKENEAMSYDSRHYLSYVSTIKQTVCLYEDDKLAGLPF